MKTPFHGAVSLLVFLLTIIGTYALAPGSLKLRIPRTRWSVPFYFCWVPWISTGILLLLQAITPQEIGAALAGDTSLRPYTVIVTYLSLSYLAVSCEITGLYGWLALHIARRTRGRPLLLLCSLVGLSGLLSAATSADVSLVALTPVMMYLAAATNWDPMALAATHMGAATVFGLLISVSGTPNILAAQAFDLSFMRFLGWMALPTLAAACVTLGLLYVLLHRRRLASGRCDSGSGRLLPYPDPGILLHDQVGAAFHSAMLAVCLLALAVGPSLRWAGWLVAAVFGAVAAAYNLLALAGPPSLRGAIGRRGAYERRKRLHAELAHQGLRRVVSDEDLADLLLSAAQDREASCTRLAAAAATRASGGSGTATVTSAQHVQRGSAQQSWPSASRISGGGWGFSRRVSCSGLGVLDSAASLASLPSAGGSGGGGGGGGSGSPVRQWFSQRWSSLRCVAVPTALSSELVVAAADAGANLGILGDYSAGGAAALRNAPVSGRRSADRGVVAGSGTTPAAGLAGALVGASVGGMSVQLQQLLARGTAAAPPESPEWWAAAARSAEELLQLRLGSAGVGRSSVDDAGFGAQPYLVYPSQPSRDVKGGSAGAVDCPHGDPAPRGLSPLRLDVAADTRGAAVEIRAITCNDGGETAGLLTRESPFADVEAMRVQGWDGGLASASACRTTHGSSAAHVVGPADVCWSPTAASAAAVEAGPGLGRQPPRTSCGGAAVCSQTQSPSPGGHTEDQQHQCQQQQQQLEAHRGNGGGVGGKHRRVHGVCRAPAVGTAAMKGSSDPRDTSTTDSGSWDSGEHPGSASGWKAAAAAGGSAARGLRASAKTIVDANGAAVCGEGGQSDGSSSGGCSKATSYHDPTHVSDQRRLPRALVLPDSADGHGGLTASGSNRTRGASASGGGGSSGGGEGERLSLDPPELQPLGLPRPLPPSAPQLPQLASSPCCNSDGAEATTLPRRQTLPPSASAGFEGLFGCWRQRAPDACESECTALLGPSRGGGNAAAGRSDDPRHVAFQLPSGPSPLPPLPLTAAAAPTQDAGAGSGSWPHSTAAAEEGGTTIELANGAAVSPVTPVATTPITPACVGAIGRTMASPFARSAAVGFDQASSYGMCDGGGSGGGAPRSSCNSLGTSVSAITVSCGQQRMRPPSLGLLLFGPTEVSFLGTFLPLPWANVVLLAGMVVLVHALQIHGWIDSLTGLLNSMIDTAVPPSASSSTSPSASPSTAAAVFAVGWLSAFLAAAVTGQSATLLMSRAMLRPHFLAAAAGGGAASAAAAATVRGARRGAQLALVVAVNLGPALSLSGSLTALRWGLGLRQLGVRMRCGRYMVSGLLPAAVAGMSAALLVLWGQCVVWG